ncbi:MAG TPA: universal stress protein [Gemmatimonadaceae bacterium]
MPTTTTPSTEVSLGIPDVINPAGPVLVATDGTEQSRAALAAAAQLAAHAETNLVVVTVFTPMTPVAGDFGLLVPPVEIEDTRREALLETVRAQVRDVAGARAQQWKVELRVGDAATSIARAADEYRARLIITGLGEHELVDRLFGGETAIHTLRRARVPVLAVPPTFTHLPQRAVIATDFSVASAYAARVALHHFDTIRTVYLVHVAPKVEHQPEAFAAWITRYGENLGPAFDRVIAAMAPRRGVSVETVIRHGKPAREILHFAQSVAADLVVTGSRGAGLIDRILVGSTATGIIRGAQGPVLGVPAPPGTDRALELPTDERMQFPEERWAQELQDFTRRNAGRRASLEVDDPDLGAQAQEHDYPFLGAAYDHHDRRVEIMLGDMMGVRRHLTRGIGDVRAIDILRDEKGRDRALRVAHGEGQTILTLAR